MIDETAGLMKSRVNTLSDGLGFCPNRMADQAAKTVEARMRSPLRIRASNKVIDFAIGDQLYRNQLVPAVPVADFISVDGSSSPTCDRADHGAFLSSD